jgi:hypothetical protein
MRDLRAEERKEEELGGSSLGRAVLLMLHKTFEQSQQVKRANGRKRIAGAAFSLRPLFPPR